MTSKLHETHMAFTTVSKHVYINIRLGHSPLFSGNKWRTTAITRSTYWWLQWERRWAFHSHQLGVVCLETEGCDALNRALPRSQYCFMLDNGPTSLQTFKWRQIFTCWKGSLHVQSQKGDTVRLAAEQPQISNQLFELHHFHQDIWYFIWLFGLTSEHRIRLAWCPVFPTDIYKKGQGPRTRMR